MTRARGWVVGLLVVAGLGLPGPAAAAPDLFESIGPGAVISPNGDGRKDVARLSFRLSAAAHVTVRIRFGGDVDVLNTDLGRLGPGDHVFRWPGRTGQGRLLPDGYYTVKLVARNSAGRDVDSTSVQIDTLNCARLVTTRPTVYPRATAVDDVVLVMVVDCAWNAYDADLGEPYQARSRLEVRDRHGQVVRRQVVRDLTTPVLTWDGRLADGHPAPAADYTAWVTSWDYAGNSRRLLAAVQVSHEQLVERVVTFSAPAASASHYTPEFGGCNGCGDYCAPVSSTRFPGGLSFRPCESPYFFDTRSYFAAYAPVMVPAPVDRFRVTSTGGPATPGGTDVGRLVVAEKTLTPTPAGDGSATSPWSRVSLDRYPYLPEAGTPVFWSFGAGDPNAYDVASFTIDYRHYVPAPKG